MEFVQMECPSCAKKYRVDPHKLDSLEPEFKCVTCETYFTLDFETVPSYSGVATKLISVSNESQETEDCSGEVVTFEELRHSRESLGKNLSRFDEFRLCVSCGAQNLQTSLRCYSCDKEFTKLSDEDRQMSFNFDLLLEAEMEKSYKDKETKSSLSLRRSYQKSERPSSFWRSLDWGTIFFLTSLILSSSMAGLGLLIGENRNLTGIGAAIFVLSLGVRVINSKTKKMTNQDALLRG